MTLDTLIHSVCCGLTARTCRTTWERRWSDSGLTGFSLDLCSCHAYFSGPCPLFLFSHQQAASERGLPTFSELAGCCLHCRAGPRWGPSQHSHCPIVPETRDGTPSWTVARDEPKFARLGVVCFCFRTIFLIVLFSQYLKNIAVTVPVYGREKKCHTSKFYLFQVFPVRSAPHPLPFLVDSPGE